MSSSSNEAFSVDLEWESTYTLAKDTSVTISLDALLLPDAPASPVPHAATEGPGDSGMNPFGRDCPSPWARWRPGARFLGCESETGDLEEEWEWVHIEEKEKRKEKEKEYGQLEAEADTEETAEAEKDPEKEFQKGKQLEPEKGEGKEAEKDPEKEFQKEKQLEPEERNGKGNVKEMVKEERKKKGLRRCRRGLVERSDTTMFVHTFASLMFPNRYKRKHQAMVLGLSPTTICKSNLQRLKVLERAETARAVHEYKTSQLRSQGVFVFGEGKQSFYSMPNVTESVRSEGSEVLFKGRVVAQVGEARHPPSL